MAILVTDGDQRSTLAVVRSLGRHGLDVIVGEQDNTSLAGVSRYCSEPWRYPSPLENPDGFQQALIDHVHHRSYELLIPMTDVTCALVSEIQTELERQVRIALPAPGVFERSSHKGELMRLAQSLGIPVPPTEFITDLDQIRAIAPGLTYPVVVKSARSRVRQGNGWITGKVRYASNAEELIRVYEALHREMAYPLIQRRIEGDGSGLFALFADSDMKAVFAHRRLREKPPSGGVSVLRESVAADERMIDYSRKLLRALNWNGVAMVEFKIDRVDNTPMLMEVNGRFWGSLQLAIDVGVDFPYLLYRVKCALPVPEVTTYRTGVVSRWFLGDLDHLLAIWFRRRKNLSLPQGHPGRLGSLWNFARACGWSTRSEVWNCNDVRPAIRELRRYFGDLFRGLRRRLT
ncbi:MAG: ATP-grasp domain-containing protein [candidate division Zixibacteria bacterium]|nr:ATP-grasp domain-containing protein [candidate division Zixibacteria bacterium]